ncbi:MAG: TonB-dependent receptor [Acidobacteriota bacterium]
MKRTLLYLAMSVVLIHIPLAHAQIKSGTITGAVKDPSGAIIPDALVTVTNEGTSFNLSVQTTGAGDYTVLYLTPGLYTVRIEKAGFTTFQIQGVEVGTSQTVRVDATLKVGELGTVVEIKAEAPLLQTDTTNIEGAIDTKIIQSIPNINSNPMYYASLQAGVIPQKNMLDTTGPNSFGIGQYARKAMSAVSVNGGTALGSDIQLDGVAITSYAASEANVMPNLEGLQEVRVQTNTFSAEYGRGTSVIQFTTKSGTNEVHGSMFYRNRDDRLNANYFGNNAYGVDRGDFKAHYWGTSLGGPLLKNKLFGFFSYEGLNHTAPLENWMTVPTARERQGDFSQTLIPGLNNAPTPVRVYDPWSVTQVGPNVYRRAPIPNAIIPNPDAFGLKLFRSYPEPNHEPFDIYNTNNWYKRTARTYRRDSTQVRIDGHWRNHSIYGSGGLQSGNVSLERLLPDSPYWPRQNWATAISDHNPYGQIGDTIVLSPTLVVDVRYGVSRQNSPLGAPDLEQPFDLSQFAATIPSSVLALSNSFKQPPDFCPNGPYSCLSSTQWVNGRYRGTTQSAIGSISKNLKKWTIKAGAEFRTTLGTPDFYKQALFGIGDEWANQNFTSEYIDATGNDLSALMPDPAQYGFVAANTLLGGGFLQIRNDPKGIISSRFYALYTQNDYHPTSKLTVNLGLRYEIQKAPTERFDRLQAFDLEGQNPFGGPGGYVFVGKSGYGRNFFKTHYNNFGPRLGLAYRLNDKTVIRAGYGISYTNVADGMGGGVWNMFGGAGQTYSNYVGTYGPNPNGIPVGRFYDEIANPIIPGVAPDVNNPIWYGGWNSNFDYQNYRPGHAQQWNLILQRQLKGNWAASIGYAATIGGALVYRDVPQNNFQRISPAILDGWRQQYIAGNGSSMPWTQQVENPYYGKGLTGFLSGPTVDRWRLLVPYPTFPNLSLFQARGFSNYQSMIARIQHSFSSGLQVDLSYTWSHITELTSDFRQNNDGGMFSGIQGGDSSLLNLNDWEGNRHIGLNDIPHRFVGTYLYELPFGKGKPMLASNRFIAALLGGWQVGGSVNYMTGTPLEITAGGANTINNRPNRVPGVPVEIPKNLQGWYWQPTQITVPGPSGQKYTYTTCGQCFVKFNPFAFQGQLVQTPNGSWVPDVFQYGNAAMAYGDIRNPNMLFMDASLQREFRIGEGWRLQFSANVYNVLNHANFSPIGVLNLGGYTNYSIGQPTLNPNAGSHGYGTYDPRQVQLQLRVMF